MVSTCPNNYRTKYISGHVYYVYVEYMSKQLQNIIYFRPRVLCMVSIYPNNYRTKYISGHVYYVYGEYMSKQLQNIIYFRPRVLCWSAHAPTATEPNIFQAV